MEEIEKLIEEAKRVENDPKRKLPGNAYYLDEDTIVQGKKEFGDARYLYEDSGLALWAYGSGNVVLSEGVYFLIPETTWGKEPCFSLYGGEQENGVYRSLPLLGDNGGINERKNFVIFTPECAYYVNEDESFRYVVRMGVLPGRKTIFTIEAKNLSGAKKKCMLSLYLKPLMFNLPTDNFETKWYSASERKGNGFWLRTNECVDRLHAYRHYAYLRELGEGERSFTTSHAEYCGGSNHQAYMAPCLKTGKLSGRVHTEFNDTPIVGECVQKEVEAGETWRLDYVFTYTDEEKENEEAMEDGLTAEEIDAGFLSLKEERTHSLRLASCPKFEGGEGDWKGKDYLLNAFLHGVSKQVDVVARSRNYAGDMLGVRDIFQQLEVALTWDPEYCRGKMLDALNCVNVDGRPPRQYSYGAGKGVPKLDMREYIDQGLWILFAFHTYLSWTGDTSILGETCTYLDFSDGHPKRTDLHTTALEHLLRIADFLVGNLDEETGCLHILYGDWNDAIDGLGRSDDPKKEFGTGVSVMASEQLYLALANLVDILSTQKGYEEKAKEYSLVRKKLGKNILSHCVERSPKGARILHGWGDQQSFYIGSHDDFDHEDRVSSTPNSWWVLSGLPMDEEIKSSIVSSFERLEKDAPYGMKVIDPGFPDGHDKAGRISRLPVGTAENGATYNHGAVFGAMALMELGEEKQGWEQLYKIMPITHEKVSTSPFVMGNSYLNAKEIGCDGETMNDWFTGSATVVMKILLFEVFGIEASLSEVKIHPCSYLPFEKAEINVRIRKSKIHIALLHDEEKGAYLDGKKVEEVRLSAAELERGGSHEAVFHL